MKELGKIVNGNLHLCGEKERIVITVTNPSDEILKLVGGYKEVVYDEQPEYDVEKQYLERVIEDTKDAILVHWEIRDIPEDAEEKI